MESNAAGVSSKMRAKLTIIFSSRRLPFGDLHKGSCCGVFGCESLTGKGSRENGQRDR